MRIVIAPDSFKGSLSALEAAENIRDGLREVWPDAEYRLFPLADGGEGTTETLVALTGGRLVTERVTDPLGRPVEAAWGLLGDHETAVVECAAASGLTLLDPLERDAVRADSRGTGELLARALEAGVKKIIVGLGGSATNDGGQGLFSALGARFLDEDGRPLPPGGLALNRLKTVDLKGLTPALREVEIVVATDVKNPLTGPEGASYVFGPQKGADPDQVAALDLALKRLAEVAGKVTGRDVVRTPGAGAAGGLGAAFLLFTEAKFRPGIEVVMEVGGFERTAAGADLFITGEGRTDGQTAWGKAPAGVAAVGRRYGKPTVILSGALGPGYEKMYDHGVAGLASIAPGPLPLAEALERAGPLLKEAAGRLGRLLTVFQLK